MLSLLPNPPSIPALCLCKIGVVWLAGTEGAQIAPIILLGLPGSEMDPQSSARHDCGSLVCRVARGFRIWPPKARKFLPWAVWRGEYALFWLAGRRQEAESAWSRWQRKVCVCVCASVCPCVCPPLPPLPFLAAGSERKAPYADKATRPARSSAGQR